MVGRGCCLAGGPQGPCHLTGHPRGSAHQTAAAEVPVLKLCHLACPQPQTPHCRQANRLSLTCRSTGTLLSYTDGCLFLMSCCLASRQPRCMLQTDMSCCTLLSRPHRVTHIGTHLAPANALQQPCCVGYSQQRIQRCRYASQVAIDMHLDCGI